MSLSSSVSHPLCDLGIKLCIERMKAKEGETLMHLYLVRQEVSFQTTLAI